MYKALLFEFQPLEIVKIPDLMTFIGDLWIFEAVAGIGYIGEISF